ncbi:MAG: prolipoprotein diacylglyceryl transferase [Coriobacteriia bacterium]|nr:prolipoprotein diacylglyceryl transferase [Coriobacteriia bacterium]
MLEAFAAIDPVAFSLGPLTVHWYGLAYLFGFAFCALCAYYFAKRWGQQLSLDDMLTIMLAAVIATIVGGRLGYCLFYGGGYYWANPLKIFALTDGGMSFHGSLIGLVIGMLIAAKLVNVSPWLLFDLGSIGAPLALGIGRITNFINGELWGRTTDVAWGVVFVAAGPLARHPSQLYQAFLEGVVIFGVMLVLALRTPPPRRGLLFGMFLILYGVARIFAEFFREPDAQIGYLVGGWLTLGMVLSIPMIFAGVAVLLYTGTRLKTTMNAKEQR